MMKKYLLLLCFFIENLTAASLRDPFYVSKTKRKKPFKKDAVQLVGTVSMQDETGGIVEVEGLPYTVFKGNSVAGYNVSSITNKSLVLTKKNKTVTLSLE